MREDESHAPIPDDPDDERLMADLRSCLESLPHDGTQGSRRAVASTATVRHVGSTHTWDAAHSTEAIELLPNISYTSDDWPIADYEPLCLCGHGAFGQVWIVRDRAGVLRALKVLDLRSLRRHRAALRELEALRRYCRLAIHPHLISIFHIGQTDDCLYYTMELADDANTGRPPAESELDDYVPSTLRELLHRDPPDRTRALSITQELLAGLRHLHEAELAHRDVKPENVVFVNGAAKLADIGMTTISAPEAGGGGTPGYMPPDGRTDGTADTYALSKVLLEVLAWPEKPRIPWVPAALLEPDDPQARALNELFLKGCSARGENRFPDASAMLAAIETFAPPDSPKDSADSKKESKSRRVRRRTRWIAAGLLVAATSVAIWWQSVPAVPSAYVEYVATVRRRHPDGRVQLMPLRRGHTLTARDGLNVMFRSSGIRYVYVFLAEHSTHEQAGHARPLFPPPGPDMEEAIAAADGWEIVPAAETFLELDEQTALEGIMRLYVVAANEKQQVAALADALQRQAFVRNVPGPVGTIGFSLNMTNKRGLHRTTSAEPAAFRRFWPSLLPTEIKGLLVHQAYEVPGHVIVRFIEFTVIPEQGSASS